MFTTWDVKIVLLPPPALFGLPAGSAAFLLLQGSGEAVRLTSVPLVLLSRTMTGGLVKDRHQRQSEGFCEALRALPF